MFAGVNYEPVIKSLGAISIESSAALGRSVQEISPDATVFLSHHSTLLRDAGLAAYLDWIGIPSIVAQSYQTAFLAHDKRRMMQIIRQVPTIRTIAELGLLEAQERLNSNQAVVVKQVSLTEGQGLQIFSTRSDVADFLTFCGSREDVLIQPFICGVELSVNVLRYGTACSVYYPVEKGLTELNGTHPCRRYRRIPSPAVSASVIEKVQSAALAAAEIMQSAGLCEFEFIVDDEEQVYLLEINPRLAGTMRLASVASARNIFAELGSAALGEPYGELFVPVTGYAAEFPRAKLNEAAYRRCGFVGDIHLSSRVTISARSLEELNQRISWLEL